MRQRSLLAISMILYLVLWCTTVYIWIVPRDTSSSKAFDAKLIAIEARLASNKTCGNIVIDHAIYRSMEESRDAIVVLRNAVEKRLLDQRFVAALAAEVVKKEDAFHAQVYRCKMWKDEKNAFFLHWYLNREKILPPSSEGPQ